MINILGRVTPHRFAADDLGGRHEVTFKTINPDFAKSELSFGEGLATAMRGSPFIPRLVIILSFLWMGLVLGAELPEADVMDWCFPVVMWIVACLIGCGFGISDSIVMNLRGSWG